ncbi:MAG: hypothetical protein LBS65_00580 [Desulfovibrio sp.]|nr:hypothetical protein [Desulfovibrio sp.]
MSGEDGPMRREAAQASRKQRFPADDPALKKLLYNVLISKKPTLWQAGR